jgi:hypothetical protein
MALRYQGLRAASGLSRPAGGSTSTGTRPASASLPPSAPPPFLATGGAPCQARPQASPIRSSSQLTEPTIGSTRNITTRSKSPPVTMALSVTPSQRMKASIGERSKLRKSRIRPTINSRPNQEPSWATCAPTSSSTRLQWELLASRRACKTCTASVRLTSTRVWSPSPQPVPYWKR